MPKFIIFGGNQLCGSVSLSTAKNTALALMAAASLGKGDVRLGNISPSLNTDVTIMARILEDVGVRVRFEDGGLVINGADLSRHRPPYDLARKIRASVYAAGLLLGRLGRAEVALPGGDQIGSRPVDYHMQGFHALGASVEIEHGMMVCRSGGLRGATFYINRASVGTTINLMLAAALAEGLTVLHNCAKEPEVVDTAVLLNRMGANIRGAGTETIRLEGVKSLHGCEHMPIPDRIEAGTFLIAAAAAGGDVRINSAIPEHLLSLLAKLREAGAEITEDGSSLRLTAKTRMKATDVTVGVFPGFATDLQAPFGALLSSAEGTGTVWETIFNDRFRYVDELRRMGAIVKVEGEVAIFHGVDRLSGAPVEAVDIRAGVALVIAGLTAEGITEVAGIEHLDRGYERLEDKLRDLGADIRREAGE